ncbi:MAG: hypothetical protein WC543_00150 [Candidatus Omnitrophota bacterium]
MSSLLIFLPSIVLIVILFISISKFFPNKNRSIGVTIFAIWLVFNGILSFRYAPTIGFFAHGIVLFFIVLAIGIINLKNNARIAVIITFALISCLSGLPVLIAIGQPNIMAERLGSFLANLIFLTIVIVFLTRPKVKEQFKSALPKEKK